MLDNLSFNGHELLIFVLLAVLLATVVYLLESLLSSRRRKVAVVPDLVARLDALSGELETLKARLENLEARPPVDSVLDTQATTYADAMRMAREGVAAPDVAAQLGISRSEAELIASLQRSEA